MRRLGEHPELSGARLFLELRERGYSGGISMVRRYVAKVRAPRQRKAYLRIETEPGEQAQVDWGSFGQVRIGATQRPLSAFAMVLSWSRMLFIDFAFEQQADTFLRMHQRAFSTFGGVPKKLLYDNLKTVVLHHVGSTVQFNPAFSGLRGTLPLRAGRRSRALPPGQGPRRGSAIRYIRHAFFYGRQFRDIDDLRARRLRSGAARSPISASTPPRASVPPSACSSSAHASAHCPSIPSTPSAPWSPSSARKLSRRARHQLVLCPASPRRTDRARPR